MTQRTELYAALDTSLFPEKFKDYCPNGLQVEGLAKVAHITSRATGSLSFTESGIAQGADTLLVHYGLFWCGHDGLVTGWLRERLALLLAHTFVDIGNPA
jgi:putative NIF3 family GTP cyclohydrolase 1 type 2